MRDHGSENGRRKVLKNIAATAVGVSGLAGAVRAEDTLNTTDDISPQDLDVGFDPYNQDAAARFTENFYSLSEAGQDRIETQLTDDQKRAVVDMQRPATFVRTTISVTQKASENSKKVKINKNNIRSEETNTDIADRWGWDRPQVDTTGVKSDLPLANILSCEYNCQCDDNCPDNYSYTRNPTTFSHEVKGKTWSGAVAFTYKQIASWNAPICEAGIDYNAKGVCQIDIDARATTDFSWKYEGNVTKDVDPSYDDSEFTSYIQGKFQGPTLGGIGFSANPYIEIKGTQAPVVGNVLKSDSGT